MQNGSYFPGKWITALLLMIAVTGFLGIGCGKKGPPRPPRRPMPPVVSDLEYSVQNNMVELNWTVAGQDGRSSPPAAVKVFRSQLSAEEAGCENCPIRYSLSGDIPIHPKESKTFKPIRMHYTEFVEPGYRYIYKVIVFDEHGIRGKDSNIVKFDHQSN